MHGLQLSLRQCDLRFSFRFAHWLFTHWHCAASQFSRSIIGTDDQNGRDALCDQGFVGRIKAHQVPAKIKWRRGHRKPTGLLKRMYRFTDENKKTTKYWRDIGTLDAYYDANMDLCRVNPEFNLYDPEWPLRTHQVQAPPAKFVFAEAGSRCGQALDSVISPGCIVSGSRISGSVLCPNVRVHSFCEIEECILMPGVRVGRHARIRRAIIDRDVLIPRGALIGFNSEEDRRRHTVTDSGIVVVTVDDEPYIGPLSDEALRFEADADRRGGGA